MRKTLLFLLLLPITLAGCESRTEAVAEGLRLQKIGTFQGPVYVTNPAGSKKVYVVEQEGRIRVRTASGWRTFLDIRNQVQSGGEQGLLSIAFAPRWSKNGLFYIYYTNNRGQQVVAEGRSWQRGRYGKLRRVVLRMNDFAANHNGGQLQFGPGGFLFIGTGDGGEAGDPERTAQNPYSLLGKILRIRPYEVSGRPYSIPSDNPYSSGGGRGEVFSLGLRNPWRFSFADGRIWIGDVGQSSWEEINAPTMSEARGGNFGWSAYEGPDTYNSDQSAPGRIAPVLAYTHAEGCSVTGGYVVGDTLTSLSGRYMYGDFCSGQIRSFLLVGNTASDDQASGLRVPSLASFGRGRYGQIWAVSTSGPVYRILPR